MRSSTRVGAFLFLEARFLVPGFSFLVLRSKFDWLKDKSDMNVPNEAKKTRVQKFEDLKVYAHALALTDRIYELTRRPPFKSDWGLRDQMRRASVSILSNIAEGFERDANKEFAQFLSIAKGSCGELRAQLSVARNQKYITDDDYKNLREECRAVGAMLAKFIDYLKTTPLRGLKFKGRNQGA